MNLGHSWKSTELWGTGKVCFSFGFSTTFLLVGQSFNLSWSQYLDLENKGLNKVLYKVPSSSRVLAWLVILPDLDMPLSWTHLVEYRILLLILLCFLPGNVYFLRPVI